MRLNKMPDPLAGITILRPIPRKAKKVMVLIRPEGRGPRWWPKDDGAPAWATLDFSPRSGYYGYSVGCDPEAAILIGYVGAALRDFGFCNMKGNGKPIRQWEVKLVKPEVIK